MSVGAFRSSIPTLSRTSGLPSFFLVRVPHGAPSLKLSPTPILLRRSVRAKSTSSRINSLHAASRVTSPTVSPRPCHSRARPSLHASGSSPSRSVSSKAQHVPSITGDVAAVSVASATTAPSIPRLKTLSVSAAQHRRALKRMPWMQLIKLDLSALTVVTAAGGYLLAGGSIFAVPSFAGMLVGSSLCAMSAAIFNQLREIPYDRVMQRTRNRPLPMGQISERDARWAGYGAGLSGTGVLALAANPAAAAVGAATIFSYVHMYTPMKRLTPLNTEFGAVVGALPPIIGWVAATGGPSAAAAAATSSTLSASTATSALAASSTSTSLLSAFDITSTLGTAEAGWLFATLFAWQMHHFMAITWRFRKDYDRAGFQMISRGDVNGDRTLRKGAFWAASMATLPPAAVALGIANPMYMVWGTCANIPLWYSYYKFYQERTKTNARNAMVVGFIQLPLLMAFLVFSLTDREKYTAFRETLEARAFGERLCVYVQGRLRLLMNAREREIAEEEEAKEEKLREDLYYGTDAEIIESCMNSRR